MQTNGSAGRFVRFGSFEADLQEGGLTKMGSRIRLQEQPFRILALLLERSGQLVTREEIRQTLWSPDTFVGFDDALNTAVRKLREALNDSADNPRFLETVPRRGYRFVAPVARPSEPQDVAPAKSRVRRYLYLWPAAALIVAGTAVGAYWHFRPPSSQITHGYTIVLADFANSTGDAVFEDTLETALSVSLRQSPFLDVVSDGKVAKILSQLRLPADKKLTPEIARELCRRADSKAYVVGSIGSLGSKYVLGLKAVNCQSADTLAQEQVTAASKEMVLEALGEAAFKLRGELGESFTTVRTFDGPQAPEKSTSVVQPSLASVKVPRVVTPRVDREQAVTSEVEYIGEDVTVRHFTYPTPPRGKPAADGRVANREVYIGDDVTVRYFAPTAAKRLDSR